MRHTLCLAVLASAPFAAAQNTFVVPSKAARAAPGAVWSDASPQLFALWGTATPSSESIAQYLYDVADIPVASANLRALSFRQQHFDLQVANSFQTTVTVSVGPNAPTAASSTFASNRGPNPVQVFSGSVNLPRTNPGGWPAVWEAPLPFAQPVPYAATAGSALVVEFGSKGATLPWPFVLEGYRDEGGTSVAELYRPDCLHSGGAPTGGWGWSSSALVPGGSFDFSLYGYPVGTPSLATNALFFGVQGLGSQVGPFTTPFSLTQLGLPSPANCEWAIDILGDTGYPMTYVQGSNLATLELPSAPIPNDPTLSGAVFYTQNVALDTPAAGQSALFPSVAIEWTIGPGTPVPCARVSTTHPRGAPPATGTVVPSDGATLRLSF